MRYRITTPERRFSGEVAGVAFANGRADVDSDVHAGAIRYFRRRGYGVEALDAAPAPTPVVDLGDKEPQRPSKTAGKDELVAYVVAELNLPEADAKAKTRVELLDLIDKHEKESEQ